MVTFPCFFMWQIQKITGQTYIVIKKLLKEHHIKYIRVYDIESESNKKTKCWESSTVYEHIINRYLTYNEYVKKINRK